MKIKPKEEWEKNLEMEKLEKNESNATLEVTESSLSQENWLVYLFSI